jgi:DNA mismatch endonuclease (patch repair protein)
MKTSTQPRRHDIFTQEERSAIMAKIRSRDTRIERLMAKSLKELGLEYVQYPQLFGNPDFLVAGKIVVFCDGDFWHGYKIGSNPRFKITDNREFWMKKIRRNIARDRKVLKTLSEQGWKVMRFWGHDITKDPRGCARAVMNEVTSTRAPEGGTSAHNTKVRGSASRRVQAKPPTG